MTLFGIRVIAHVIKDPKMRSSWIRMGPKSNDKYPYKREKRGRQTSHRRLCEDR